MSNNKRRTVRRVVNSAAWMEIDNDARLCRCRLVDISANGARLFVENIDDVPDSFTLLLSRFGRPAYHCNVVWRLGSEVGVQFVVAPVDEAGESVEAAPAGAGAMPE